MKGKYITTIKRIEDYLNLQQQKLNRTVIDKPKIVTQQEEPPIVYSLKPLKYTIPKDVPVVDIFRLVRRSRYDEERPSKAPLNLSPQDKANRREYIEKMKLFIVCEKFSYSIVSYSIYYMDLLISMEINTTKLPLEHIFIGSMTLAIKYYSVESRVFLLKRLQKFMRDTSKKHYEIDDLLEIEIMCLKHLNYKLNWIHTNHFIQMLLLNGVVFNIDVSKNNNASGSNIYDIIYAIMDLFYETGDYFPYDSFHLSCAIVTLAREICGFTPWSSFLAKVFNIELNQFEGCLESVRESYNNPIRNMSPIKKEKEIQSSSSVSSSFRQNKDEAEIEGNNMSSLKQRQIELIKSADKGVKTRAINFKLSFQEVNKEKERERDRGLEAIQSQRSINTNTNAKNRLSIIKENDVNSTEDNSFVSNEKNFNRTSMIQKDNNTIKNYRDKDKERDKEEFNVMKYQHSSKNILRRDFNFHCNYPKEEIKSKRNMHKLRINNYDDDEDEDEDLKEIKANNEQIDSKKDIRKKGTINLSRQFHVQRMTTIQDKGNNNNANSNGNGSEYRRFNQRDQMSSIENTMSTITNDRYHHKVFHNKK